LKRRRRSRRGVAEPPAKEIFFFLNCLALAGGSATPKGQILLIYFDLFFFVLFLFFSLALGARAMG
jgi:hypothetical protein